MKVFPKESGFPLIVAKLLLVVWEAIEYTQEELGKTQAMEMIDRIGGREGV